MSELNSDAYDKLIPDYADVFTVAEYRDACESHGFIDYDGIGHPIKDGKMSNMVLHPSQIAQLPPDCDHVAWFNK